MPCYIISTSTDNVLLSWIMASACCVLTKASQARQQTMSLCHESWLLHAVYLQKHARRCTDMRCQSFANRSIGVTFRLFAIIVQTHKSQANATVCKAPLFALRPSSQLADKYHCTMCSTAVVSRREGVKWGRCINCPASLRCASRGCFVLQTQYTLHSQSVLL